MVKALDSHGTRSGRPTAEAKIIDCGATAAGDCRGDPTELGTSWVDIAHDATAVLIYILLISVHNIS